MREDERETWGSHGVLWASPSVGRSRTWPARGQRAASTRSAYWPGEEDDRKEEVGWAESARPPGKWASGKSLLPFLFLSVFYFL